MRTAALLALVAAAAAAPIPAAAAAASDAPLGVATPGPLRALFLDLPLADARGPSAPALDVRWTLANSWSVPTRLVRGARAVDVQLDAQVDTLSIALALPWRRLAAGAWTERLSTVVEARALALWGGWSDGGIERWHALLRFANFEREAWPRDRVALRVAEPGGPALAELGAARLALGDVMVRTALRVAGAGRPDAPFALALRCDVKLPTGSPSRLSGSGGLDAGAGAAATWRATRWLTAHALASVRAVSGLPRGALQPRTLQAGLDASLVARLGPIALLLEDRVSSPLFEDGWELAPGQEAPSASAYYAVRRPQNQVSVGLRWRGLTAWVSEDFTPGDRVRERGAADWFYDTNAPDLALGVAWAHAL